MDFVSKAESTRIFFTLRVSRHFVNSSLARVFPLVYAYSRVLL